MRGLLLPLLALALAACTSAPKRSAPPPSAKAGTRAPQAPSHTAPPACAERYAPAQEDLSKRGDYKSGGLYAPGVADTTPDYIPNVDCIAEPTVTSEARSAIGNRSPYTVLGKRYEVMQRVDGYVEKGTASYYGSKFHGRRTSNQEVYDMYAFTAAHKTLPLPSFARVTHLDNGASVVVRVNDRGPFHDGRVIDLSYAAAVKLGITQRGTGRVEVRALTAGDDNLRTAAPVAPRPQPVKTTIATGVPTRIATGKPTAMDELVGTLPESAGSPAVASAAASPSPPWRYQVAPEPEKKPSADEFAAWMQTRGVRVATGKPVAVEAKPSHPGRAERADAPRAQAEASPSAPDPVARAVASAGDVQLQVASFASRENADRALARLSAAGIARASLSDIDSNGRRLWRLRVAAADSSAASEIAGRIAGLGFGQPQMVRE